MSYEPGLETVFPRGCETRPRVDAYRVVCSSTMQILYLWHAPAVAFGNRESTRKVSLTDNVDNRCGFQRQCEPIMALRVALVGS